MIFEHLKISFTYLRNKRGPRKDPCDCGYCLFQVPISVLGLMTIPLGNCTFFVFWGEHWVCSEQLLCKENSFSTFKLTYQRTNVQYNKFTTLCSTTCHDFGRQVVPGSLELTVQKLFRHQAKNLVSHCSQGERHLDLSTSCFICIVRLGSLVLREKT